MNLPTDSVAPPSVRSAARFDAFGTIHKAIRLALVDMLTRMGQTHFADRAATATLLADLESLLVSCERHAEHEERFVRPALSERLHGDVETFAVGHAEQCRFHAELRSLVSALDGAAFERRGVTGKTLYLHFSTYVAEQLAHMAEEERVVQPLLERLFRDDEMMAMHAELVASIPPPEAMESMRWMLRAVSAPERIALVADLSGKAPREVVAAVLASIRAKLSAGEWDVLAAVAR